MLTQNFLSAHGAASSFLWGLGKTLLPLPSPSGFVLMGAEVARPAGGSLQTALRLIGRVILPGAAGVTLGSIPYYWWSRRSGKEAVARWGPRFGMSRRRIENLERRAEKRRRLLIWTLFAVPVSPVALASVAAGLTGLDPLTSAVLALTGAFARILLLTSFGWAFRSRFGDPIRLLRPEELFFAAVALAGAGWLLRRRFR